MTEFFDLIIQNGTVMTPAGRQKIDVGVLAGVIDSQAHFREPGLEHKADLESGTRPARESGIACERGAHYHERRALPSIQHGEPLQ